MLCIICEHGRIKRPVFVELRWELNEIAGHTAQSRVPNVREYRMQRVTKLMKHRRHIIKAQERRLACGRFREVANIDHDRLRPEQIALIYKTVLPCAAIFVRPLKIVSIEQRQRLSVCVEHFKDSHIGLVDWQVFSLLECDAVEFVRRKENSVMKYVLELEVLLHLRFVEIVFGLAHFLRVKLPVHRPELKATFLSVD